MNNEIRENTNNLNSIRRFSALHNYKSKNRKSKISKNFKKRNSDVEAHFRSLNKLSAVNNKNNEEVTLNFKGNFDNQTKNEINIINRASSVKVIPDEEKINVEFGLISKKSNLEDEIIARRKSILGQISLKHKSKTQLPVVAKTKSKNNSKKSLKNLKKVDSKQIDINNHNLIKEELKSENNTSFKPETSMSKSDKTANSKSKDVHNDSLEYFKRNVNQDNDMLKFTPTESNHTKNKTTTINNYETKVVVNVNHNQINLDTNTFNFYKQILKNTNMSKIQIINEISFTIVSNYDINSFMSFNNTQSKLIIANNRIFQYNIKIERKLNEVQEITRRINTLLSRINNLKK